MLNISTENTTTNKFILQFLPKSIEFLSIDEFTLFKGKKLKTKYCIDIVHNLLLRYYFKKENIFNLSSLILKEKYGYLYNYYIDYLLHIEAIVLVKEYMVGKNARIYKLNVSIINDEILRIKNDDKTLLKKQKNIKVELKKDFIITNIKQKLISDLYSVKVGLNKAMYYLENIKQDIDCYHKNKYSVDAIYNKHIFYHFDEYGRFHTNFTILKSFIRKNCLTINNEDTYEKDISNSQPLFLAKLIHNENIKVDEQEFNIYCKLVMNGNFYQFLMDKSKVKSKKECKENIYHIFFGKNITDKKNIFAKLFPSIYNFIIEYKNSHHNYKILSHVLQQMESEVIFNKIIYTLNVINPDITVITIHDSIIVQQQYREILNNVFNSIIEKEFNFIN